MLIPTYLTVICYNPEDNCIKRSHSKLSEVTFLVEMTVKMDGQQRICRMISIAIKR